MPERHKTVRLADVPIPTIWGWMLRYLFPPAMAWALRERQRGWHKAEKSAANAAAALASYLAEARKLQVEGQKVADATRRLTWVVVGLTVANVVFVAYSALR